jgi:hypothetical protein
VSSPASRDQRRGKGIQEEVTVLKKGTFKSGVMPLALLWLAVHAALLAVILAAKFLTAKTMALLLVVAAGFWLLTGRRKRTLSLPAPALTGKDAHA